MLTWDIYKYARVVYRICVDRKEKKARISHADSAEMTGRVPITWQFARTWDRRCLALSYRLAIREPLLALFYFLFSCFSTSNLSLSHGIHIIHVNEQAIVTTRDCWYSICIYYVMQQLSNWWTYLLSIKYAPFYASIDHRLLLQLVQSIPIRVSKRKTRKKKLDREKRKEYKNHWHPGTIRNFFDLNIRLAYNDLIKYLTSKFLNIS